MSLFEQDITQIRYQLEEEHQRWPDFKIDVFLFLHGYCDTMLDLDPQPQEGKAV